MRNNQLKTPLHIAARNGYTEIARHLLHVSVCSINLIDVNGGTPLYAAVKNGSISMIKLLLENGANPMIQISEKKIALDFAIKYGDVDIVSLLLDELKEDQDEFRKVFPLHSAVERKRLNILKLVLKKHYAEIDQVNELGQTCFDLAIDVGFREGVEFLLSQKEWKKIVRRRYAESSKSKSLQSPMQNLILNMPDMAMIVLDKCISSFNGITCYNYEFIDDTYILREVNQENYLYSERYTSSRKFLLVYCGNLWG